MKVMLTGRWWEGEDVGERRSKYEINKVTILVDNTVSAETIYTIRNLHLVCPLREKRFTSIILPAIRLHIRLEAQILIPGSSKELNFDYF